MKKNEKKIVELPAFINSGKEIQVPIFINEGDMIKIDTRDGTYASRAKNDE